MATMAPADAAPRRPNGRTKANAPVSATPRSQPAQHQTEPPSGAFVHRLDLTGRCFGSTPLTRAPVDLTSILSNTTALNSMCDDLVRPFRESRVEMVVAVHDDSAATNSFTAVIAGALAVRCRAAIGQVSTHRAVGSPPAERPRPKKRGRSASKTVLPLEDQCVSRVNCQRVVSFDHEPTGLYVEYRREMLGTSVAGVRVLLVADWIDSTDALLATRDALITVGMDVVGLTFVVATSTQLLKHLTALQINFSCSWSPTSGAQLTVCGPKNGREVRCQCDATATLSAITRAPDEPSAGFDVQSWTSHYEANAPSEDRSVNTIKPLDPGVRVHVVFDGHGGPFAVEHLRSTLCSEILSRVSSESTDDEVESALRESFFACDAALKSSLDALPGDVRMSKGYCNAGACAVVALFVKSMLYIANVGDCGAVIGHRDPLSGRVWARELSIEHNCSNPNEVKLVMDRSRDRNAIRLSKDDQENENAFGVRRVAGSLAVTRAFGDFYLKCEDLSSAPFKSKVPYITVEPSINRFDLKGEVSPEHILVLASDGLWEVVGCEEAIKIASQWDTDQSGIFPSCSAALVHVALEKVAHRDGMLLHEVMALPRGRERRRYHDDVTCTVVRIKARRPRLSSVETLEETDSNKVAEEEQTQSPVKG